MLLIGHAQLSAALLHAPPAAVNAHFEYINKALEKNDITTGERIAGYIATIATETNSLRDYQENLNYSTAERLYEVFRKDFKDLNDARNYVKQPVRAANRVYANQNGNGPESSGDGWRFRGRAGFHHTGRGNYAILSKALGVDLLADPDKLLRPEYGNLADAHFWTRNGLNKKADNLDAMGIRKTVNGGLNGYTDFLAHWFRARKAMGLPDLKVTIAELAELAHKR